ncbi:tRNA-guanine transglycosylase [bacterium]|nr:tRNA-guanine transglycosylase [bacterium]
MFYKQTGKHPSVGEIHTDHGIVKTPNFTPVGTKANVKSLVSEDLENADLIFANTYHLFFSPGVEVLQKFGGVHKFMNRNKPIITDSGGFQVFSLGFGNSLSNMASITDKGVEFTKPENGLKYFFSPKVSIQTQRKIGADIILAFDDCAPYYDQFLSNVANLSNNKLKEFLKTLPFDKAAVGLKIEDYVKENAQKLYRDYIEISLARTHNWSEQSLLEFNSTKNLYKYNQHLLGIVQGGTFDDLREESAKYIASLPFEGFAIGGVSVGETKDEMVSAVKSATKHMPVGRKPIHLLGVGEIDDFFNTVEYGITTFDCVIPTRWARTGYALTKGKENNFRLDLRKADLLFDKGPILKGCSCSTCKNYSRGYLAHLVRNKEISASRLISIHNLYFLNELLEKIRKALGEGKSLSALKSEYYGG